jgi:hypothetical protein
MKLKTGIILGLITMVTFSCSQNVEKDNLEKRMIGTWRLISSESHVKDSVIKEDLAGREMFKIITNSHFAFLYHDLQKGKDSKTALFVSGGGKCSFTDTTYTENLDYCNCRMWEGVKVNFKATVSNDTLTIEGLEKADKIDVNQYIIEKYIKL